MQEATRWAPWGRGFRPFFLLAGLQAVFAVGLWLAVLRGLVPAPGWSTPFQWHAHEMLFGFGGAAIAGFLLTSVPAWTGCAPVTGPRLMSLALLWTAGRGGLLFAPLFPSPWIVALLDASFFAVLAGLIAPPIIRSRRPHNFVFPLLMLLLAMANLLTHMSAMGGDWPQLRPAGTRLALGIIVLLMVVLGGRLVPLFTGAALKRAGSTREISRLPWADTAAAPLLGVFILLDTLVPGSQLAGIAALLAAVVLALRMKGWGLAHSLGDPLLWSMQIAYLWLPIGLAALGLSAFSPIMNRNIGVHALTVGGIGGMILAIMSRVALGHTGRSFQAPRGMALAYALVFLAAGTRTILIFMMPGRMGELLMISGLLWSLGFSIFLVIYVPILVSPRIDGKTG